MDFNEDRIRYTTQQSYLEIQAKIKQISIDIQKDQILLAELENDEQEEGYQKELQLFLNDEFSQDEVRATLPEHKRREFDIGYQKNKTMKEYFDKNVVPVLIEGLKEEVDTLKEKARKYENTVFIGTGERAVGMPSPPSYENI